MFDPVVIIFSFNMSKPSQPTHFDHQTDWFQLDMGVAEFKLARRWKKISLAAAQKFKWVEFGFPKWSDLRFLQVGNSDSSKVIFGS